MQLQGRDLSLNLEGEDVALLQRELRQLGFTINDPERWFQRYTMKAVKAFQEQHNLPQSGKVDERTAILINQAVDALGEEGPFIVKGHIQDTDGSPLVGGIVRAFDRDLRREQPLGESKHSDNKGFYEIKYTAEQFRREEKKSADLIVRVYDQQHHELAASHTIFNAKPVEEINLRVGAMESSEPSEYQLLVDDITPLLDGASLVDLAEDEEHQDYTFLANETGQDYQHIALLAESARLENQAHYSGEIFYGLIRMGLPTNLSALLSQSRQVLRQALEAAIDENIISRNVRDSIEEIVYRLHRLGQIQIPIKVDVFKVNTGDIRTFDPKTREYINNKLNANLAQLIVNSFDNPGEGLKTAINSLELNYLEFRGIDLQTVINEHVLPTLRKNPSIKAELEKISKDSFVGNSVKVEELLQLDKPLRDNPVFSWEIRRVKTLELANISKLDKVATSKLADKELVLEQAGKAVWENLVKDGIINEVQRKDLELAFELSNLTDDNFKLIEVLKTDTLKSMKDLVTFDKDDWLKILRTNEVEAPVGETPEEHADTITFNIEQTYPSQFFMHRAVVKDKREELNLFTTIQPLMRKNRNIFGNGAIKKIDWEGINPADRAKMEKSLLSLTSIANTYKHLGVAEILNDQGYDIEERQDIVNRELGQLNTFYQNNPDIDLRFVNFFEKPTGPDDDDAPAALIWDNIAVAERPKVRKQLMAFQRVMNIAPSYQASEALLTKGLDSSIALTKLTKNQLINTTGLSPQAAEMILINANQSSLRVAHSAGTVLDTRWGLFNDTPVGNLAPSLVNELREIDGYEDLFGIQNYCECDHCKSIFSPAAYFVDLMYFIEKHVSRNVEAFETNPNHPLDLRNRRSDLWDLELTCDNTNTIIPYLEVVNKILESYIEKVRPGIGAYDTLRDYTDAFTLPFHLPLEELRIYLKHFELSLADIFETLKQSEDAIAREQLQLSQEELSAITKRNTDDNIYSRFRIPVGATEMKVLDFLKYTGITRKELDQLIPLEFIIGNNTKIKIVKTMIEGDIQNYDEELRYLDRDKLDRIHRFIRLWRRLPWSMKELDMVLSSLEDSNVINLLDLSYKELRNAVNYVASLVEIQARLNVSVEELCSFFHQIPVTSVQADEGYANLDKLPIGLLFPDNLSNKVSYNAEKKVLFFNGIMDRDERDHLLALSTDPEYQEAVKALFQISIDKPGLFKRLFWQKGLIGNDFQHTYFDMNNPNNISVDPNLPHLLADLSISEAELLRLLEFLKAEPEIEDGRIVINNDGKFTLSHESLSTLYRHAKPAKVFKLSIEDFLHVVELKLEAPDILISKIEHVRQLIHFMDWLKTTPFSIEELWFIMKGDESAKVKYKVTTEQIIAIVKKIQEDNASFFNKKLLSEIDGVSEADSETFVNQLKTEGLVTESSDGVRYRLTMVYDLQQDFTTVFDAINADNDLRLKEVKIRKKLNSYHNLILQATLKPHLIDLFNITQEHFDALSAFTKTDITDDAFVAALNTIISTAADTDVLVAETPEDLDIVISLIEEMERILLLFDKLKFESTSLQFIAGNHNNVFKIINLKQLTLKEIECLVNYKELLRLQDDSEVVVHQLLSAFKANVPHFTPDEVTMLSKLLKSEESLVNSLLESLTLTNIIPPEAIARLMECTKLCSTLGINGFTLNQLVSTDFDTLQNARNTIYGAFKSKYDDEKTWKEIIEPFEDKINMKKRDALCDYILAREDVLNFKDKNELFSFFLIDVEMGGCGRISRVKAAISSLQLYIHRCLVNLEQSQSEDVKVVPEQEMINEWEWRKNYRVWEANRKVFLYPENYIEPELRDNKTPIFKELEDELLQQKITSETAENAYKKYVTQFAEAARLKISGNYYHEANEATDTLYLFGRTHIDPPQYYHRKLIGRTEWTPWEKIELGINSDSVSAIIHLGKLYVFWVEVNTKEVRKETEEGGLKFDHYEYTVNLQYSYLNETGKWISPQRLEGLYTYKTITRDTVKEELTKKYFKQTDNKQKKLSGLGSYVNFSNTVGLAIGKVSAEMSLSEYFEENLNPTHEMKTRDDKQLYENSKSFKKSYPKLINGKIIIAYFKQNKESLSGKTFYKELDLYNNRFNDYNNTDNISVGYIVTVYQNKTESTLGRNGIIHSENEGVVDINLVTFNKGISFTLLTKEFDNEYIDPKINNVVHNNPLESIVQLKEQQFLIRRTDFGSNNLLKFTHETGLGVVAK